MAHFRGTLQGSRGEVSRLGHKTSGLTARVNGWDVGVSVNAQYYEKADRDALTIYANCGSNGGARSFELGTLFNGGLFVPSAEVCAAVDKLRGVK